MTLFNAPSWLKEYEFNYRNVRDVPESTFVTINRSLDGIIDNAPVVSIIVSAWNEEINILRTIASLSRTVSKFPLEIIVVNNNSSDNTQYVLDKLHVISAFQPIQGWGPARQMGLEKARGKYVLLADADCIYPKCWVDDLVNAFGAGTVSCVYGRYSFISSKGYPRWKLFLMERMKDAIAELRHVKRPYLNAFGMSMGVIREQALQVGFVMHKIRGEDGRMCFDLMQFGSVKQVRSDRTRVWTNPRTLQKEGSFIKVVWTRMLRELSRLHTMTKPLSKHDTKKSVND